MTDAADHHRIVAALGHVLAQWPPTASSRERREFVRLFDTFAHESETSNTAADPSRWETTAAAADRLGITPQAVRLRCKNQTLPAYRVGRQWLIRIEDDR